MDSGEAKSDGVRRRRRRRGRPPEGRQAADGAGEAPGGPRLQSEGGQSRGPRLQGEGGQSGGPRPHGEGGRSRGPRPHGEGGQPRGDGPRGEGGQPRGDGPRGEGGRSRRRRRRKGGREPVAPAPEVPSALESTPVLDTARPEDAKPAEEPLTPEEVRELTESFAFMRKHRQALRLKLNAAEDLLVNGSRPPTHRGVCMHLLRKVDNVAVQGALDRIDDPEARVRLLEGAIRLSSDIGLLLSYLELLERVKPRDDAATALSAGIDRIDFERTSAAQMRRLLELIVAVLPERERPALLLGLLPSRAFRAAFDQSLDDLPPALAGIVVPVRAVYAEVLTGSGETYDADTLARGVRLLLTSRSGVLRRRSPAVKKRLFARGVELLGHEPEAAPALRILLESFPADDRVFSELAMMWVRSLLAAGRDGPARELLAQVRDKHPDFRQPGRWLKALEGERIGRVALEGRDGEPSEPGRLRRGLWLDHLRPVWVRTGGPEDAERFAREGELHRRLRIPGVAPLLTSEAGEQPHHAVAAVGRTARAVFRTGVRPEDVPLVVYDGLSLLHAVAGQRVQLPDADPDRFLIDAGSRPWLCSLAGAIEAAPPEAYAAHAILAVRWCENILESSRRFDLPPALRRLLAGEPGWAALFDAWAQLL